MHAFLHLFSLSPPNQGSLPSGAPLVLGAPSLQHAPSPAHGCISATRALCRLDDFPFSLGFHSLRYAPSPAHVSVGAKGVSWSIPGDSALAFLLRPALSARRFDAFSLVALALYGGEKNGGPDSRTVLRWRRASLPPLSAVLGPVLQHLSFRGAGLGRW